MRIKFLGSGDAFGTGGRFQACILLESDGFKCLLDCGASSLIAMKKAGIDPNRMGSILISHLHGDHFGGLPFMLLDAQFSHRTTPVSVFGPPGISDRVRQATEILFPGAWQVQRRFEILFTEIGKNNPFDTGPFKVIPFEVVHESGAPSYGFRIEAENLAIAYSGDTEWTENLIKAAEGAEIFISEAWFYERPGKFHMDFVTLLKHRSRLGCKRLIVTHMGPGTLQHAGDLPVETAYDGLEITL